MSINQQEENVVSDLYDNYAETQKEILGIELRNTRNKLISVAAVIFFFDLVALVIADVIVLQTFLWILVVPVIMLGLAFLANKEPLIAMIAASVVMAGLWAYSIILTGGMAVVSGWLNKAIIIYLLIAGFQNAREAARIRKELKRIL